MIGVMYWYKDVHLVCDTNNPTGRSSYGTPFALDEDCNTVDVGTFYLDPAIWSGLGNLLVAVVLSLLPFGSEDMAALSFSNISKHGKERLDYDEILRIMTDTTEPIRTPVGIVCIICTTLLCNLSLPFWGDQYDNCNVATYTAWAAGAPSGDCAGPDLSPSGLPNWVVVVIACFIVSLLLNIAAWTTWKTVDHEDAALGGFIDEDSTRGNTGTADGGEVELSAGDKPIQETSQVMIYET